MSDRDFLVQLQGYGLLTAEVSYYMPDHPKLLQLFVWQEYDVAPQFPVLHRFLDHWRREIEATLHSIRAAPNHLIRPRAPRAGARRWGPARRRRPVAPNPRSRPAEWRAVDGVITIN